MERLSVWPAAAGDPTQNIQLQRDIAVFFARIGVFLVFKGAERGEDAGARVGGLDDGVDVAALGGNEWIGEAFAEFGNFFLAEFFALGFGSFVKLALVHDIDGALRAHDGDLGGGPGEVGVGSNVLRSHDAICATVSFAGDDGDLRDGGFGKSEEQLRAMPDDAAKFLLGAREKTGNILEGNERNVERVAEPHEARAFHGSVDIENTGKEGRLIADDTDGAAVEARKTHDEILRVMFVDFEEIRIVNNRVNGVLKVIRLLGIGGNEGVERFIAASWGV